jgi:hypothetical protein
MKKIVNSLLRFNFLQNAQAIIENKEIVEAFKSILMDEKNPKLRYKTCKVLKLLSSHRTFFFNGGLKVLKLLSSHRTFFFSDFWIFEKNEVLLSFHFLLAPFHSC